MPEFKTVDIDQFIKTLQQAKTLGETEMVIQTNLEANRKEFIIRGKQNQTLILSSCK